MNDNSDALAFSEDALSNRPLFLSSLNDINIFVEDDGKEYIYEEILERLLGDCVHIFCIFPLGGKSAVLQKHRISNKYDAKGNSNIFIVDGDFDNLWDENKVIADNLIYLDRYNIESYYCTKDSAIKYMRGILRKTREQTEAIIDFDTWFRRFQEEFGKLFALFALVQHYCPVIPNVGDVMRFLDTDGSLISDEYLQYEKQVAEHIDSIDAQIQKVFEKTQYQITNSDKGTSNFSTIICGKCQLESFCRHLKICSGKNINRENIRNSFIMTFDLEPLQFIRDRVLYLLAHGVKAQNSA